MCVYGSFHVNQQEGHLLDFDEFDDFGVPMGLITHTSWFLIYNHKYFMKSWLSSSYKICVQCNVLNKLFTD